MSDERPPFDQYYPRAITPMAGFDTRDSQPKIPVADVLEGVPRLRSVQNLGGFVEQLERAARDTEPAAFDDATPADRPFEIRVERELKELRSDVESIKESYLKTAQHTVDMYELVKAIDRRQRAFDVERRWIPWVFRLATLGIALYALYRTYR